MSLTIAGIELGSTAHISCLFLNKKYTCLLQCCLLHEFCLHYLNINCIYYITAILLVLLLLFNIFETISRAYSGKQYPILHY